MAKKPLGKQSKTGQKSKKAPARPPTRKREAATATAAGLPSIATLISQIVGSLRGTTGQAAAVKPLPAGTPGTAVPITLQSYQQLITATATQGNQGQVVWTQDSSELTVFTNKVTTALDDGLILITIPVSCDQLANAVIQVPFAGGSATQPAGMVCATEQRPRGPDLIVDVWGDALIAFAWKLILTVATRVAAQSGVDEDGAGLVPITFSVAKDGLTLLPIARHAFDRVQL
jgi:hypothetical protein